MENTQIETRVALAGGWPSLLAEASERPQLATRERPGKRTDERTKATKTIGPSRSERTGTSCVDRSCSAAGLRAHDGPGRANERAPSRVGGLRGPSGSAAAIRLSGRCGSPVRDLRGGGRPGVVPRRTLQTNSRAHERKRKEASGPDIRMRTRAANGIWPAVVPQCLAGWPRLLG